MSETHYNITYINDDGQQTPTHSIVLVIISGLLYYYLLIVTCSKFKKSYQPLYFKSRTKF